MNHNGNGNSDKTACVPVKKCAVCTIFRVEIRHIDEIYLSGHKILEKFCFCVYNIDKQCHKTADSRDKNDVWRMCEVCGADLAAPGCACKSKVLTTRKIRGGLGNIGLVAAKGRAAGRLISAYGREISVKISGRSADASQPRLFAAESASLTPRQNA